MRTQITCILCIAMCSFPLIAETAPAKTTATAPAATVTVPGTTTAVAPTSPASATVTAPSQAAQQAVASAFALNDSAKVIASLVSQSAKASSPADKKLMLSALADYEERLSLFVDARKHFNEAAFADPAGRDDAYILDAARCALVSGDTEQAEGLVRAILLTSFSDPMLVRARVYSAWIQLAAGDAADALPQIRTCAANTAFADYAPALLFTLWWSDNDSAAKTRLLSDFSTSPEASIVRGEIRLSPAPFWYLMVRNGTLVADFARDGNAALATVTTPPTGTTPATVSAPSSATTPASTTSASTTPASTTPPATAQASPAVHAGTVWQQTGFFKNREYAEELNGKLVKLGFKPVIREEKRPSGIIYFSVLVPEDAERSTEKRLKDAGFESYLLID